MGSAGAKYRATGSQWPLATQVRPRDRRAFSCHRWPGSDLWPLWGAISCPTLVLRGAESDLLAPGTAAAMRTRGPRPAVIEFPGVGHAPMLLSEDQMAPVIAFLDQN